METKAVSSDWSNVSQLVRENDSIKIVNYLDGFLIEERDSRTQKKWRSHKTNNSEQNHGTSCASFDLEILDFQNLTRPFDLNHSVYSPEEKRKLELIKKQQGEEEIGIKLVQELDYKYKHNDFQVKDFEKVFCEETERSSITSLFRTTGDVLGDPVGMDELSYSYQDGNGNSNLLLNVSDGVSNQNTGGFVDGNTNPALDDYEYDPNGNMIKDRNKGITSITYNHLNLPVRVEWSANEFILYQYNAAGQKLTKTVRDNDSIKIVRYLDGFQYAGSQLQFFPTSEGYVKATPVGNANPDLPPTGYAYNYTFNYTDHLGNIRLSYTKDPQSGTLQILEENHYYPFGLRHEIYVMGSKRQHGFGNDGGGGDIDDVELINVLRTDYQYKYNGFEYQDELDLNWYDYMARNYDPALGRWMNVDPLAEQMRRHSPYNYAFNNPVFFIDPDGMKATDWYKDNSGNYIYDSNLTKDNASTMLNDDEQYLGERVNVNVTKDGKSVGSISLNENGSIDTSNLDISTKTEYNISTGIEVVDANFTSGGKIYGVVEDFTITTGGKTTTFNIADNFIGNAKDIYEDPVNGKISGNEKKIKSLDGKLNRLEINRLELRNAANNASADGPTSGGKAASLSITFGEQHKVYNKIGQAKQKRDSLKKANDKLRKNKNR